MHVRMWIRTHLLGPPPLSSAVSCLVPHVSFRSKPGHRIAVERWADVYCFPAQSKRKAHAVRLRMQSGPRSLQDHRLEAMRAERQSKTDTHQHFLKHIDSSAHWQFSRPCHAAHAQNCYRHTCLSFFEAGLRRSAPFDAVVAAVEAIVRAPHFQSPVSKNFQRV